ncbi:DUF7009 family protein [Enhygromyxa salina]|uniref:DUF7009 family protein n=1 Tax=Enhygromyxa salina TaxID=215803 RepID=UPI0011B23F58|nr:hypothetical protein [Enhygromyxa salina]
MKLRIRGDSLRLRLTRGEVQQLRTTGRVSASTQFGARTLEYVLCSADVDAAQARFEGDCIEVTLPRSLANTWADTEQVGIEAEQGVLRLLIEKDFQCLAPRAGEEDSDTFPHPDADSGASC